MNTLVKWYRYLLVLPILIPIILWVTFSLDLITKSSYVFVAGMFFVGSLVFGGIPYLICATFIFWYSRDKDEATVRKLYLLYPIGMIGIFFIVLFIDGLLVQKIDYIAIPLLDFLPDFINCFLVMSAFTLVFGYGYVLVTFLIVRLIRRRRFDPPFS
ncbi:MAG TPA: hypothetical protein DEP46_06865 [Blastocatellia bacterium]|nr:hypothetical protein [Blastocatellia bacterium]